MKKLIYFLPLIIFIFITSCNDNNPGQPGITENSLDFCEMKCLDIDCKNYEFIARDTFVFYQKAYPRVTLKNIPTKNSGIWIVVLSSGDTVYSGRSYPTDTTNSHIFYMFPFQSKFAHTYNAFAWETLGTSKTLIDSCTFYYKP